MRVKWSQNFLADRNVAKKIVAGLDAGPDDAVLEIGPGRGILTAALCEQAGRVVAVEIDPVLCRALRAQFAARQNFTLIEGDFLEVEWERIAGTVGKDFKIIGNLPYAVLSPILQKVLAWKGWSRAVFMMQKEVADRILAGPGGKDYGILSVSVQCRSRVEPLFRVSRGCFRPAPEVESSVLRFSALPSPFRDARSEENFFATLRAAFGHRRKTIANSLRIACGKEPDAILAALESCGISPKARAETLTLAGFKALSEKLHSSGNG